MEITSAATPDVTTAAAAKAGAPLETAPAATPEVLQHSLEALIFAAPSPINLVRLQGFIQTLYPQVTAPAVQQAWQALQAHWQARPGGFHLVEVAAGWTFRTAAPLAPLLRLLRVPKPQRLSRPSLETLAIVAYRQPLTKAEIDAIRGVDCGGTLKNLLERDLVCLQGRRATEVGRPWCYGTGEAFLNLFNFASLHELPALHEFSELNEAEAATPAAFSSSVASLAAQNPTAEPNEASTEQVLHALDDAVAQLAAVENAQQAPPHPPAENA